MYNSLLPLKNSSDKMSDSEKRKILGTRLDYNSQVTFLADNFDNLKNVLSKDNYKATLREIGKVEQERLKY